MRPQLHALALALPLVVPAAALAEDDEDVDQPPPPQQQQQQPLPPPPPSPSNARPPTMTQPWFYQPQPTYDYYPYPYGNAPQQPPQAAPYPYPYQQQQQQRDAYGRPLPYGYAPPQATPAQPAPYPPPQQYQGYQGAPPAWPNAAPQPWPAQPYAAPQYAPAWPSPQGSGAPAAPQQSAAPAAPGGPARPAGRRLQLTTRDEGARTAALSCADSLDHFHLDAARTACGVAAGKDPNLAMAHLWLAQATGAPDKAAEALGRAVAAAPMASRAEQLFVEGWRAAREGRLGDAQRSYDMLCFEVPDEPRAFTARGLFRQGVVGDAVGGAADFERAAQVDPRYAAAHNLLGFARLAQRQSAEAEAAFRKYVELAPSEPNAHDSMAMMALRLGDAARAAAEARKAVGLDGGFAPAHLTLGDALLALGQAAAARAEYDKLDVARSDGETGLRHEAAMRGARSFLFEEKYVEGERALLREGDRERKAGRRVESAEALLEAARSQIDRAALSEAGRSLAEARKSMEMAGQGEAGRARALSPAETRILDEIEATRALALAGLREGRLAAERLDSLARSARPADAPRLAAWRSMVLARTGEEESAVNALAGAADPSARLTYAQLLARGGESDKARPILEALARQPANDIDTALTRPRAASALRLLAPAAGAGKPATPASPRPRSARSRRGPASSTHE